MTAAALKNWIGLWINGQNWPLTGEIDGVETLGKLTYHVRYGPAGKTFGDPGLESPGRWGGDFVPGTHTFGVLWTTKGVTFYYDGVKVGSGTASLTGTMYLIAENSNPSSGAAPTPATVTLGYVHMWRGRQRRSLSLPIPHHALTSPPLRRMRPEGHHSFTLWPLLPRCCSTRAQTLG